MNNGLRVIGAWKNKNKIKKLRSNKFDNCKLRSKPSILLYLENSIKKFMEKKNNYCKIFEVHKWCSCLLFWLTSCTRFFSFKRRKMKKMRKFIKSFQTNELKTLYNWFVEAQVKWLNAYFKTYKENIFTCLLGNWKKKFSWVYLTKKCVREFM